MISKSKKEILFKAAKQVLDNSYSPYSKVKVASAIIDNENRIFSGVNVENASFGLTICAERSAIVSAITNGAKDIRAVLIISTLGAIPPCGACRQVIAEFAEPSTPIYLADRDGIRTEITIGELLPHAFKFGCNMENGEVK